MHWAGEQGRKHDLKMALFSAFFTDRADVNDPDVLVRVASQLGLEQDEARRVLESGDYADAVRQEQQHWTSHGIQGVPAMVFQRKYLRVGAQGIPNYEDVLRQLTESQAA